MLFEYQLRNKVTQYLCYQCFNELIIQINVNAMPNKLITDKHGNPKYT